jgi:DNA-binding PadR family transcriptional regulator
MAELEMREPTFLILMSLATERKHGYAIIKDADELSGGRVRMKVSTLYAALDRLAKQGLVVHAGDEAVDGRLRRYFELTDAGDEALRAETDRLEASARAARERLAQRRAARAAGTTARAALA